MGSKQKATDAALVKHGIADTERAEFLDLYERYRDDIVEVDGGMTAQIPSRF